MGHILVVEDDEAFREFLTTALEEWGHDVDSVSEGQAAYQRIYLAQPVYDLILCDLVLPGLQGPDLLHRAEKQVRDRTPVVVVSGKERAIDALGDAREWIFRIVKKPCEVEELRKTVEQALWVRAGMRERLRQQERIHELEQRVHDLVRQNVALFEEARIDPLSGLPNRRRLEEDLGKKYANVERYGAAFAVALCDVDAFRRYNDEFGYEGGDKAIRHVARTLQGAVREGDTVYRFGGDEFVVVMEAQGMEQAWRVADRLRGALAEAPGPHGVSDQVTMSVGIATAHEGDPRSITLLLREANRHLSAAKREGGNRVRPQPTVTEGMPAPEREPVG